MRPQQIDRRVSEAAFEISSSSFPRSWSGGLCLWDLELSRRHTMPGDELAAAFFGHSSTKLSNSRDERVTQSKQVDV